MRAWLKYHAGRPASADAAGLRSRTTPGERRVVILRYGPPWARPRFGYTLSPEFLERLTPERRRIMDPIPTMHTGNPGVPLDLHSSYTAD